MHFRGKHELRYLAPDYEGLSLADEHAVLNDHRRRWASLFVIAEAFRFVRTG